MALRPLSSISKTSPKKKPRTSKTRDRDEGPERPQEYVPPAERLARRVDARTLISLGTFEDDALQRMRDAAEKRGHPYSDEVAARRIFVEAKQDVFGPTFDKQSERRRLYALLNAQIPAMLTSKRYGDAIRAVERCARLYGLDEKVSFSLDVTGREAMLEALGLASVEELDALIKRGQEELAKESPRGDSK